MRTWIIAAVVLLLLAVSLWWASGPLRHAAPDPCQSGHIACDGSFVSSA
jgi:hypothetical protein